MRKSPLHLGNVSLDRQFTANGNARRNTNTNATWRALKPATYASKPAQSTVARMADALAKALLG